MGARVLQEDDPVTPHWCLPLAQMCENQNVIFASTKYGGHLGWTSGRNPLGSSWSDSILVRFLQSNSSSRQGRDESTRAVPIEGAEQYWQKTAAVAAGELKGLEGHLVIASAEAQQAQLKVRQLESTVEELRVVGANTEAALRAQAGQLQLAQAEAEALNRYAASGASTAAEFEAKLKVVQLESIEQELRAEMATQLVALRAAQAEVNALKAAGSKKEAALRLAQAEIESLMEASATAPQDTYDKLCFDVKQRLLMLSKHPSKL